MVAQADIDHWYKRYHQAVNMTEAQLRRWADDPCSKLASLDDAPIERNLRLLSTPKRSWRAREVADAKRTVGFIARMCGVRPGKPAGKGCPSKRDIALKNWAFDPDKAARPNRRRPHVYDAQKAARNMRETFQGAPSTKRNTYDFDWAPIMHNVGDSLAVAYSSDKWRDEGDMELYKHLAESRNRALVVPGLIHDYYEPDRELDVVGPLVDLSDVPMPKHFAELALFEEVDLKLYQGGSDAAPRFGEHKDDGVVKVTVKHGLLGGSVFCWSQVSDRPDQLFLFVYTERDGPLMIVVGDELDVEKDGIVG